MVRTVKNWQVSGMPCFDSVDRSRWWLLGDRWVKEDSPCQWVTTLEASQGQNRSLQRAIQEGPEVTHPAAQARLESIAPEPQELTVKQVQEVLPQFTWKQRPDAAIATRHPITGLDSIHVYLAEGLYVYSVDGGYTTQATTSLEDAAEGIMRKLTAQRDLLNQVLNVEPELQVKDFIAEVLGTKGFQTFNFKHSRQMSECAISEDMFGLVLEVRPQSVALRRQGLVRGRPVDVSNTEAAVAVILTLWDKTWGDDDLRHTRNV
jgi:hypothetical protein